MAKSKKILLYCVKNIFQRFQSFVVMVLSEFKKRGGLKGRFFGFWCVLAVFYAGLISKMTQNGLNQEKQGDGVK